MARTCKKRVKNANGRVLGKAREFPKRNAYIITLSNGNQGAVTNRLQNEVASGKSVQETTNPWRRRDEYGQIFTLNGN
jgi:hypothetical protein